MTDMYNDAIKVSIKIGSANQIVYLKAYVDFRIFLTNLNSHFPETDVTNDLAWRIYWIDSDGDKIEINRKYHDSYNIFLQAAPKRQLFVEPNSIAKEPLNTASAEPVLNEVPLKKTNAQTDVNTIVHEGVCCDKCDLTPIVGFRYKCIQCIDFDLCSKCEASMAHPEHFMMRISKPTTTDVHVDRHFMKKIKRGYFNQPGCQATKVEAESRHHGKHGGGHRSGRHGCRSNIFTNLYTAMHDLAEGTEGPSPTENLPNMPTAPTNEGGTPPQPTPAGSSVPEGTPVHTPQPVDIDLQTFMDPEYMKAGVEILNNFSTMFAKMLDPLGVNVHFDIDLKDNKNKSSETEQTRTETAESGEPKSNTAAADTGMSKPSTSVGLPDIDMETTSSSAFAEDTGEQSQKSLSTDDNMDWTMIDKEKRPESSSSVNDVGNLVNSQDKSVKGSNPAEKSAANQPQSAKAQEELSYAKLASDLRQHMEAEIAQKEPPKEPVVETRAQIVFHKDPRINDAVISMMAMGFSNEGAFLTQLLDSVNGNISQALDIMKDTL